MPTTATTLFRNFYDVPSVDAVDRRVGLPVQ